MKLKDSKLFRQSSFINGEWRSLDSGASIDVINPLDNTIVGKVPAMGVDEAREAVDGASEAFPDWAARLPQERTEILMEWYRLMMANREDLARLMTEEQGKPINEARGEIAYAASFIQWFAEEAKRVYGETIPSHLPDRQIMVLRQPIGVTACVTPWNFPSAMITRKAAAALAAGCPMIVRPASETPFSALALAELAQRAGFPAGVFSVITGSSKHIVGDLCTNPKVRALSFTGSTEVGRLLMGQGASTVTRMSMELGGNAPFIVFPDVDLDNAVCGAVGAKFQTTGQDCLAANRIFVHRSIYDDFLQRFVGATEDLRVGPGMDEKTEIGPMIHHDAMTKCQEHVDDAVEKGARLLTGGSRHERGGFFFQPTVLADVTDEMNIFNEETFGPVAAVIPFEDEDEVLASANNTEYGLTAYVYTRDLGRAIRMTRGLEYGMVAVNCVKITGAPVPFGGVKQSGLGREGSRHGIEEYTEIKYACIGSIGR